MELNKKNPVIFVVSGKANSGKNTFCDMIANNIKLKNLKSVDLQIASYIKMYAKVISGWDGSEDEKPRKLLQELGTEIIRKQIDSDFFIKRIISDIVVYSYYFDVITISDARFPEEIISIDNNFSNVIKIRIERPNFENDLDLDEKKHITETALDNYNDYDYVVINDGSLDDLNNKVINIINEVM